MISLTKINGEKVMLNSDLIETITKNHDTIIQLTDGKRFMVLESPEEVREKVIEFRRRIFQGLIAVDKE
jgi:flagellar protein FlbD